MNILISYLIHEHVDYAIDIGLQGKNFLTITNELKKVFDLV